MLLKRVLRRIFTLEREEESGDLRKLHNEKLHNCYILLEWLNQGHELSRT
jgi:hypothetical protein